MDLDRQVGPLHHRTQVTHGGASAATPADGDLKGADAFLLCAVEISVEFIAGLLTAGDKGIVQFVVRAQVANRERPADTVKIVGAALLVLGATEIRQDIIVGPTGIAHLAPSVEILPLAADVDETINRRRASADNHKIVVRVELHRSQYPKKLVRKVGC